MNRITQTEYIQKLIDLYGNKYNYDNVNYIDNKKSVIITCHIHGDFLFNASDFLYNGHCKKCRKAELLITKQKRFIEKSKKIHKDKYDYSNVEYVGSNNKVNIICPVHREFFQSPNSHLEGRGCSLCANILIGEKSRKKLTKTQEQFLIDVGSVHGNKYDYSKVIYESTHKHIIIICSLHGEFEQTPSAHLMGQGCPTCSAQRCGKEHRISANDFIKRSIEKHGEKYDYSKTFYSTALDKIKIICRLHGEFEQSPYSHLSGCGCPACAVNDRGLNKRLTTDIFIQKARELHGIKYNYDDVDYKSTKEKIKIICPIHGEFLQIPNNHLTNRGCAKCNCMGISRPEKDLSSFIKENYTGIVEENTRAVIPPLEIDIYLPELKLAFEFNGLYWHNELNKPNDYHQIKTNECEANGIHLIHIYEDDWMVKQDIIKSRILNLLGKSTRIFARKCELKTVNNEEYRQFITENHRQGYTNADIKYGLYYENSLISLMSFGKARFHNEGYELLRFANKLNITVVGGAERLFKKFLTEHTTDSIISYADRSWSQSNKNLYKTLGFTLVHLTQPNFHYIINSNRVNRFGFRKNVLVENGYDVNKTEREIMLERNIYRIYDSGQLKYKY